MLDTYKSETYSVAARQVEIQNYTVLCEGNCVGWNIQVAISQNRPLILFRAEEWDGRRPRFAVTATQGDHFRRVLQDLAKQQLEKRDPMQTLNYEDPIWITGGV